MTPSHVLVPVDDPAFIAPCCAQLMRFFSPENYHITLLRVAEPPDTLLATPEPFVRYYSHPGTFEPFRRSEAAWHPIYADQIEQNLQAAVEKALYPLCQELRAAGYRVDVAVRFGDPAEEIADFVQSADVDLVCMATHGRTGLSRLVLGSVAEQVLRSVDVPVLLMHPARDAHYQRVAETELEELEVHA